MNTVSKFNSEESIQCFSQLHPNSWAFVKAFEIVCLGLDLNPSVDVFFSFYHIKSLSPGKLVSISSQPNRGLFTLFVPTYHDTFFRMRCGPNLPDLIKARKRFNLFDIKDLLRWETDIPTLIVGISKEDEDTIK
ncbi:hypothetical protein A2U01_0007133 [Trifolium medium]|uniref:Uncharacterized protein n=1 Tax=Trifolium medium TaxID=97028 RepID=A0A392MGV7_9FABA|nr:hypothetical protein [Trifolium medium]